jgi:hypothetical protein
LSCPLKEMTWEGTVRRHVLGRGGGSGASLLLPHLLDRVEPRAKGGKMSLFE